MHNHSFVCSKNRPGFPKFQFQLQVVVIIKFHQEAAAPMVVVAAWCFGRRRRRKFVCSQQTSTNSNLKTTTSYSPTTTNSKHDITQQFSGERQTATISISDFAHKIKTITNTKMHEMHLDIVIITDVPIFTGAPIHSLENTEPKFGTGNARSSKEGHETSAKASESLPFECSP